MNPIDQAAEWILASRRLVVFTGAGLSTESGIPDFRSPGGVWSRYDPADFDFQNFLASEASREKYWQLATEMYAAIRPARPNAAHQAVYELDRLGKLAAVITQNIDGLHERAGHAPEKIIELHGTALHVTCLQCGKRYERDEIQQRLEQGIKSPVCDDCGGPLKPATISFGQAMPERETREAYRLSSLADLFMVIGSSLVVQPAASLPLAAKRSGARLVIINRDPTPYDDLADLVIPGSAGPILSSLVERVKERLKDQR
ncbi:MAG: Sir2 family NAD-dependent protein deacetylase [Deltaproteobacteria bacterium]|nr:Sir2 family NAD-dependent protein deacetylase [Deltaproteobacteria bacterium]